MATGIWEKWEALPNWSLCRECGPCRHPDLGLPASRTVWKRVSTALSHVFGKAALGHWFLLL
jgi:hypothetical protein